MADEFNGIRRPRVSFFQEDLAADRLSSEPDFFPYAAAVNTTAYTLTPDPCGVPSFEYYCSFSQSGVCEPNQCPPNIASYDNGIAFQALTLWSGPIMDGVYVDHTLNATPNDALEGAFNAYFSQYLEVYPDDLGHAIDALNAPWDWQRWQQGLKSWHDYFAHLQPLIQLEGPANLTVLHDATNGTKVQWAAVPGATSYSVDRSVGANSWDSVCPGTSNTYCPDVVTSGSTYGYRVIASNGGTNPDSPYSYVALFLSQMASDGSATRVQSTGVMAANNNLPGPRDSSR